MDAPGADLFVFDFDGTLIDSAAAKRQAFYDLFPSDCAAAVTAVLQRDPDGSRHALIPEMICESGRAGLDASALVTAFGEGVRRRVTAASAVEGAEAALAWAARRGTACVFSMTPHEELQDAIVRRRWMRYLAGAWGYPNQKPKVLSDLMERYGAAPDRAIVIGDGVSDEEAARRNGCRWLKAEAGWPDRLMRM